MKKNSQETRISLVSTPTPSPSLVKKRPKTTFSNKDPLVWERLEFGEKLMERIVKIEKTNSMTNTWKKTKTKTDKDKNVGE